MNCEWDFTKLPIDKWSEAIEAIEAGKIYILAKLHNDYNLSKNDYCCSAKQEGLKNWWRHGIKNYYYEHVKKRMESKDDIETPKNLRVRKRKDRPRDKGGF